MVLTREDGRIRLAGRDGGVVDVVIGGRKAEQSAKEQQSGPMVAVWRKPRERATALQSTTAATSVTESLSVL